MATPLLECEASSRSPFRNRCLSADGRVETASRGGSAYVRRGIELFITVVLLALLLPLFAVVATVIKITSSGPAFYLQQRVGLRGQRFWMFKFRTMRTDAEVDTGPVWAVQNDARCTMIGGFLRRYSIDELPQLINVLRGGMSLIGPRPERPHFVQQFAEQYPEYDHRHLAHPGMTGWAQVNGWRGNSSLTERLRCDLEYVRHRCLTLDAFILLLTPLAVVPATSAVAVKLAGLGRWRRRSPNSPTPSPSGNSLPTGGHRIPS